MMKVTRIVALAVIGASFGIGALHAQSLRNTEPPAEFPPASFKGAQYVDSRGCVFIRAGIDGNVTWIPRVTRQRQLLCGQTPSLSAEAAQAARVTPRATADNSKVEQITVTPPAQTATAAAPAPQPPAATAKPARVPQAAAPAPAPAPRRQATVAPAPKPAAPKPATPVVVERRAPVVAPAPRTVAAPKPAPAAPAPVRTATVTPRQPACPGAAPVSSRYINSGEIAPVRCGPQVVSRSSASPIAPVRGQATPRAAAAPDTVVSAQTRVVPRQVHDARRSQGGLVVPEGYRPVWEDDRLNPRRAEQSLEGIARTRLVWTQTVPRRLIEQRTGRDVTTRVALVYPYTDSATQTRELGTVTLVQRDGQLFKRIERNKSRTRAPTVSTRSATTPVVAPTAQAQAQAQAPKAAQAGRFVQVGTFGQPANAQAAAQRIMRAGLPARIGKVQKGGKSYQVVLAGPFATSAALGQGLQKSRAAGFGDAFVR